MDADVLFVMSSIIKTAQYLQKYSLSSVRTRAIPQAGASYLSLKMGCREKQLAWNKYKNKATKWKHPCWRFAGEMDVWLRLSSTWWAGPQLSHFKAKLHIKISLWKHSSRWNRILIQRSIKSCGNWTVTSNCRLWISSSMMTRHLVKSVRSWSVVSISRQPYAQRKKQKKHSNRQRNTTG